jgi:hypothetical protein
MATTWNPADMAVGNITLSNSNMTATGGGGPIIGVAVDLTANRLWFWNPTAQRWNGAASGTQNPATGTGGYDISYITGAKFPAWSGFNGTNGDVCLANFGASAFQNALPSGFSSWDTLAATATTWNPSDKSPNISLSGSNLIATAVTTTSTFRSVRATTSASSGKGYFELQANTIDTSNGWMACIGNSSALLTNYVGSSLNGLGYQAQGSVFKNGSNLGTIDTYNGSFYRSVRGTTSASSGKLYLEVTASAVDASNGFLFGLANASFLMVPTQLGANNNGIGFQKEGSVWLNNAKSITGSGSNGYTAGATPALAVDFGAQKIWFYSTQSGNWNNAAIGSQNPATGTGGISITALGSTLYPVFTAFSAGTDTAILNTGGTTFANTVPSGFSAWDGVSGVTPNISAMVLA